MNDILDPHFHRMQPQYFSAAMQKPLQHRKRVRGSTHYTHAKSAFRHSSRRKENQKRVFAAGRRGAHRLRFSVSANRSTCPSSTPTRMRRCGGHENAPAFTEKTARARAVCTRKTRQIEAECAPIAARRFCKN